MKIPLGDLLVGVTFGVLGYAWLIYTIGWGGAAAVFLLIWSNNILQNTGEK